METIVNVRGPGDFDHLGQVLLPEQTRLERVPALTLGAIWGIQMKGECLDGIDRFEAELLQSVHAGKVGGIHSGGKVADPALLRLFQQARQESSLDVELVGQQELNPRGREAKLFAVPRQ